MTDASPTLTRDDIRAAVSAGTLSEAQAASLIVLAEERAGLRQHMKGLDEPFELFKGFNEVFIVVGLAILYLGWSGLTGFSLFGAGEGGFIFGMGFGFLALLALVLLSKYFIIRRRMVAPAIALTVMVGLSGMQFGLSFAAMLDTEIQGTLAWSFGITAAVLTAFYSTHRVPFAVALIALSVFGSAFGLLTLGGTFPDSPSDLFLLSAKGPFALLTIGLGLVGFVIAMWFDMSDPHRVTRRAQAGFWLHVIAAPAIVNTVALTLFEIGTVSANLYLTAFVILMAMVAIVIDRRSFLVAAVGYMVALAITVADEDGAPFVILALGAGLVLLGAKWEALRRSVMRALPAFPGKTRLPPYDLLTKETPA